MEHRKQQGKVSPSLEDYLEAILVVQQRQGSVRSVDVAEHLGFSKPSVSIAMRRLVDQGHVTFREDSTLALTDSGLAIAKAVYERHRVLTGMLVSLGVDPVTAEDDACRIEHVISPETFQRLKNRFPLE